MLIIILYYSISVPQKSLDQIAVHNIVPPFSHKLFQYFGLCFSTYMYVPNGFNRIKVRTQSNIVLKKFLAVQENQYPLEAQSKVEKVCLEMIVHYISLILIHSFEVDRVTY